MRHNAPKLDNLDFLSPAANTQPRSLINIEPRLAKSPSFYEHPKQPSLMSPVMKAPPMQVTNALIKPVRVQDSPCMISDTQSMSSGTSSASTRHQVDECKQLIFKALNYKKQVSKEIACLNNIRAESKNTDSVGRVRAS